MWLSLNFTGQGANQDLSVAGQDETFGGYQIDLLLV